VPGFWPDTLSYSEYLNSTPHKPIDEPAHRAMEIGKLGDTTGNDALRTNNGPGEEIYGSENVILRPLPAADEPPTGTAEMATAGVCVKTSISERR